MWRLPLSTSPDGHFGRSGVWAATEFVPFTRVAGAGPTRNERGAATALRPAGGANWNGRCYSRGEAEMAALA
ncbi:hypothetical protein ON010_g18136 [Phytophthora cinnamomi]|nr:hypothetical protein ON010_g18136 [Phytophthora cinnamomi]